MSDEERNDRMAHIRSIAERLEEPKREAREQRDALSAASEPKFEAALSRLAREVHEAASVARKVTQNLALI